MSVLFLFEFFNNFQIILQHYHPHFLILIFKPHETQYEGEVGACNYLTNLLFLNLFV